MHAVTLLLTGGGGATPPPSLDVPLLEKLFGRLRPAAERASVLAEPEQSGERRAVQRYRADRDIVRVAVCMPTCRVGEPDDFVLDVMSQVLGASKASRLYRRLVLDERRARLSPPPARPTN